MVLSPDVITNIAFGSVMVLIGLVGIWIVKWSTDRMVSAGQHTICALMSTSESISGINDEQHPIRRA
jgi:hypothetical protein